jgi:hypothetical protein
MTPRHWTEDELLAHLYGVGPEDGHLGNCAECRLRIEQMRLARESVDAQYNAHEDLNFEFLAAQRRRIYNRILQPTSSLVRRLAPALAASLVLVGGLLFMETQRQEQNSNGAKVSDTDLVEDVGRMAMHPEPAPTAPLQALFED